jgi:hypothetical protein
MLIIDIRKILMLKHCELRLIKTKFMSYSIKKSLLGISLLVISINIFAKVSYQEKTFDQYIDHDNYKKGTF